MATLIPLSNGKFKAVIRRTQSGNSLPTKCRYFPTKEQAEAWIAENDVEHSGNLKTLLVTYRDSGLTRSRKPLHKHDIEKLDFLLKSLPPTLLAAKIGFSGSDSN